MMLSPGCEGLRVRRMTVWWTFRRPCMGRPVPRQLMRNELLDLITIVSTTAHHRRSCAERYSRFTQMGGGLTSGTSTPKSIGWARTIRRKSRASTSICGPGSHSWYAAPSVFPRRSACTIWSLGCSSIAMNLDEPYETGSTPLRHLPITEVARQGALRCRSQEALRLNILRKPKREVAGVVNHGQNSGPDGG